MSLTEDKTISLDLLIKNYSNNIIVANTNLNNNKVSANSINDLELHQFIEKVWSVLSSHLSVQKV